MCGLVAGIGSSLGLVLGYLATNLRSDLGVSRGAVGLLASIFFGATGAGSFSAGTITDRIGPRRAANAQMVLLAAACLIGAAGGSYEILLVACVIGGFGYALGTVGTNLAIVTVVSSERQARAMTLRTAGVATVSLPSAFLGPAIAEHVGWRPILVAVAVVALASTALVSRVLPADSRHAVVEPTWEVAAPKPGQRPRPVRLPTGFFWFPIGAFCFVAGVQAQLSWAVPYLSESLDTTEGNAGALVALSTAMGIGVMLSLLRHADAPPGQRLTKVAWLSGSCAAWTGLVALGVSLGPAAVVVGLAATTAASLGAVGGMQAAVADAAPYAVGRATGVTFTGYFLGSLVAPTAFGALVDRQGTYTGAWLVTAATFALAAVAFTRARRVDGSS
ncbi:MFS transporter [soil metagenome]